MEEIVQKVLKGVKVICIDTLVSQAQCVTFTGCCC